MNQKINLFVNKNKRAAEKYYNVLIADKDCTLEKKSQIKIDLAIIAWEMNRKDTARSYLTEILQSDIRGFK